MKILITVWGNPQAWREVKYKFGEVEIRSKTSLKILQEKIKPDKTIIIGLDTLAERGSNYKDVKEDVKKKIRKYADEFELKNYDLLTAPGIGVFQNGIFHGNALDYYHYIIAKLSFNLLKYLKRS
jgi:CRISPR-associated protein Csx1